MKSPSQKERGSKTAEARQSSLVRRFGERVHAWRTRQGLPLKHVATDLDVSESIISEWENGHRFPSLRNLEMPELDGIAATHRIKRSLPDTCVLMHSFTAHGALRTRCLAAGATAFFAKGTDVQAMGRALRGILEDAGEPPQGV